MFSASSDELVRAAVAASEPRGAVANALSFLPDAARVDVFLRGKRIQTIQRGLSAVILGMGKASAQMTAAVGEFCGDAGLATTGLCVTKYGHASQHLTSELSRYNIEVSEAGHPQPDKAGEAAARRLLEIASPVTASSIVFVCISGGGSALTPMPAQTLTLRDIQDVNAALLSCGATIHEVNTVRKHLSAFSGGRLSEVLALSNVPVVTLALSDVTGDDTSVIASGPTVADPTTFSDARRVLSKYGLWRDTSVHSEGAAHKAIPHAVIRHIERGCAGLIPDTPKAVPAGHSYHIVGSNALALAAVSSRARELGYAPLVVTSMLQGEAGDVGAILARVLGVAARRDTAAVSMMLGEMRQRGMIPDLPDDFESALSSNDGGGPQTGCAPLCIIFGGETTVTMTRDLGDGASTGSLGAAVPTTHGLGGRNQHLALAAALELHGMARDGGLAPLDEGDSVALLSFGTDGSDGPTPAAGAVVTAATVAQAASVGLDARAFFRGFDSYSLFDAMKARSTEGGITEQVHGDSFSANKGTDLNALDPGPATSVVQAGGLIVTGPTGTNVMDVVVLLAGRPIRVMRCG